MLTITDRFVQPFQRLVELTKKAIALSQQRQKCDR